MHVGRCRSDMLLVRKPVKKTHLPACIATLQPNEFGLTKRLGLEAEGEQRFIFIECYVPESGTAKQSAKGTCCPRSTFGAVAIVLRQGHELKQALLPHRAGHRSRLSLAGTFLTARWFLQTGFEFELPICCKLRVDCNLHPWCRAVSMDLGADIGLVLHPDEMHCPVISCLGSDKIWGI